MTKSEKFVKSVNTKKNVKALKLLEDILKDKVSKRLEKVLKNVK